MSLFGGMSFPVQFFLAFVIVLALIGATAWAVRRFGSGRLGGVGMRGRQPRLAVIDYASVDGRRRLILVRRDNVEHLVMIGGPTDVVVESNIVRAAAAPRDIAMPRAPTMEPPRAIPLPDNTANGGWPLQPEPAVASAPVRAPRAEPATDETAAWQPHAEAPARAPRESLAALADELSPRPPVPQRSRPQPSPRPAAEPRQELRPEPRPEPRAEPRPPLKAEPRVPAPQPAPAAAEPGPSIDQSLAEMAHKLEAALRKPKAERTAAAPGAGAAPADELTPGAEAAASAPTPAASAARNNRAVEAKPARSETKQPNPGKALYDSLEQEMASLLGRPTAKN
jgi:flagellar protein FliO/FliZ